MARTVEARRQRNVSQTPHVQHETLFAGKLKQKQSILLLSIVAR
jgi:hypothetical protein